MSNTIESKLLINTFHHLCFPVWMHQIIFSSQNPMTCRKNPHLWRLGLHVVQAGKHFLQCKAKFSHLTDICYGNMEIWQSYQMGIILLNIVKPCEAMRSQTLLDSMINWKILTQGENCAHWPSLVSSALPRLAICWHSCRQKMQRNDARKCFPAPISRNLSSNLIASCRETSQHPPSHPPPQFCTLYPLCYCP